MVDTDVSKVTVASMKKPKARIDELIVEINQHLHDYHVLDAATIPDEEYDKLFAELVALEKANPGLVSPNSPTQRIGAPVVSFNKVRHKQKMLSLDNAFNAADLLSFFSFGSTVSLEPKIDGLSVSIRYEGGRLARAVTRGDGIQGDDVTANVRTIVTVPLVLPEPMDMEVRGEVYMPIRVFDALNVHLVASGADPMANPRNAASGTLKLRNPAEVAARKLAFVAYNVPHELDGVVSHSGVIEYLEILGFQTPNKLPPLDQSQEPRTPIARTLKLSEASALTEMLEELNIARLDLNCATDGLVFKIDDLATQRDVGEGTRAPKWAVAYKFPPEQKVTKLRAITVQVGKTGKLTPVAELEPLTLSGTEVARASLMNADEVARLGVNVGDDVFVLKSAEIIPRIVGVEKKHSDGVWAMPPTCPCCQAAVTRPEGLVDYFCTNVECSEQVFARLRYSTGKEALDMDGSGEALVRELIDKGGVRKLSQIFTLEDVSFLKPAARTKFLAERERVKAAPLWRKLAALCVDGIGRTLSQEIAGKWSSLIAAFDEKDALRVLVGNVNYTNLVRYIEQNGAEIDALDAAGFVLESDERTGPLTGKSFVITGTLTSGKREDVAELIQEAGGIVKSSVTRKVNFLVVGAEGGANKAEAARKLGTICISEEQLFDMLGKKMPIAMEGGTAEREF